MIICAASVATIFIGLIGIAIVLGSARRDRDRIRRAKRRYGEWGE